MQTPLTSVSWLKQNLNDPDLIILDATIPVITSNKTQNSSKPKIKGARFFDIKNIFSDPDSSLPNTMPSSTIFQTECRKLGINANSKIVVYDEKGIYSSPRVWFMFKLMCHNKVAVLDGGLPEWMKLGGACSLTYSSGNIAGDFKATYNQTRLKEATYIMANIKSKKDIVIDARSAERYLGKVPEPRKHLKRGHIPNSLNLHFASLLKDGKFLPYEQLRQKFDILKIDNSPIIFSCGSGITACITILAASMVLENDIYLYDGSWTEWGNNPQFPIETL